MEAHYTLIGLSTGGIAIAGLLGEWLLDANNIGKLGLCAFMALCLIVLVLAILALCRFIVKILMPLNNTLIKLNDSADANTKILVEVKDSVRDCHARK